MSFPNKFLMRCGDDESSEKSPICSLYYPYYVNKTNDPLTSYCVVETIDIKKMTAQNKEVKRSIHFLCMVWFVSNLFFQSYTPFTWMILWSLYGFSGDSNLEPFSRQSRTFVLIVCPKATDNTDTDKSGQISRGPVPFPNSRTRSSTVVKSSLTPFWILNFAICTQSSRVFTNLTFFKRQERRAWLTIINGLKGFLW